MGWTREEDDILRECCGASEAMSATAIGQMITQRAETHRPLTRSAVISRARRLGVKLPIKANPRRREEQAGKQARDNPSRRLALTTAPVPREWLEPPPLPQGRLTILDDPTPDAPGVLLMNAALGDCRRPISGSGLWMRVCGDPTLDGMSHCATCFSLVYTKLDAEEEGRHGTRTMAQAGLSGHHARRSR